MIMMSKYSSKIIYKGKLRKYIGDTSILADTDILLIYDEKKDVFYSLNDTLNLSSSNDLDNLSREEKEENQKLIDKYTYRYGSLSDTKETYIDEETIEVFIDSENKVNKR